MSIDITDALNKIIAKGTKQQQQERHRKKLAWESEAVSVIKDKIEHFKKTGNARKLAIYEAKLKTKQPIINKLRKLIN